MTACGEAALGYAARGWRVLPVWGAEQGRCLCPKGADCESAGKHPISSLVPHGVNDATTDPDVIRGWWERHPEANVAIACGIESGVWVLDCDPRNGGDVSLEELERKNGTLPTSIREKTGGNGLHIIFRHPGDGRISGKLGPGLDVKGDGGYIVAAPSVHVSGGSYVWLDEEESVLEAAPFWLVALVARQDDDTTTDEASPDDLPDDQGELVARRKLASAVVRMRKGHSRHVTAVWTMKQLRDNRVSRKVAATLVDPLLAVAKESKDPRTPTRKEFVTALKWAYQTKPRKADDATTAQAAGRSLLEIAAISSDIERHHAIKEAAEAEGVPVAAVKAEVYRLRAASAAPPPDDWRAGLIYRQTAEGQKLENCVANVAHVLRASPEWTGLVRRNEFSGRTEFTSNGHEAPVSAPVGQWTDGHTLQVTEWLQKQMRMMVNPDTTAHGVSLAAESARYHPVREYLDGLVWDGEHRLDHWLEDLAGASGFLVVRAMARRFLVSAVARIYEPGCKADHALILEGLQNLGKSFLLSILFSPWFTDDLEVLGSKDSAMQLRGVWCLEIAELSSMHRSDIDRTKSFITRRTDRFRPPYGREVIEVPRSCVLAGTVNGTGYLRDDTGNRRFWPVTCTSIDLELARARKDQLWAEAVVAYKAGEKWWLDSDELVAAATAEQDERYQVDSWEERIAEALEPFVWQNRGPVTIARVLDAIHVETAKQDRAAQMRAGAVLRRLGREMRQLLVDGVKLRVWLPAGTRRNEVGL